MRRLLLVFLSILLPLQFAWAGAAAYCAHESADQPAAMTSHFGHHSHEHKADQHESGKTGGKSVKLPDADCTACHSPVRTACSANSTCPVTTATSPCATRRASTRSARFPPLSLTALSGRASPSRRDAALIDSIRYR